jgi:hypothetical protein
MPNDFLSNLSARAIQTPEAESAPAPGGLRPRLASLFEPASAALMPGQDVSEAGDQIENASQPTAAERPGSDQDQNLRFNYRRPDPSAPVLIERIREEHFTEINPAGNWPKLIQPLSAPILRTEKEAAAPSALMPVIQPPPSPKPQPAPDPDRQSSAPAQPVPDKTVEQRVSMRVTPEQIILTRREQQPKTDARQLVPAQVSERGQTQASLTSPNAAQAPTINVTIGRIEVKASNPAPLSKRSASAPVHMSLDEYLRQRQGGTR